MTISQSSTLKAAAWKAGWAQSAVKSAEFTITGHTEITAIKSRPDGVVVGTVGAVVSRAFADFFYIEAGDRSSGIRVEKPGHGLTAGTKADVAGTLGTNADGERYIAAASAIASGTGSVLPLGLTGKTLGGGDWLYDPATGAGQKGVQGGAGLNNIGLLVTVSGVVTQIDPGGAYFYLEDGSGVLDGTLTGTDPNRGIRIPASGASYQAGQFLTVTGISSCFKDASGNLLRVVLVASAGDIR